MQTSLSAEEARRLALHAQGFRSRATLGKRRPFDHALAKLHVLQIDSVNVFARSHYLPVFSRHGQYSQGALDRLLWDSGEYTEYWAHEAAFLKLSDRPLFSFRMDDRRERDLASGWTEAHRAALEYVRARLRDGGPLTARTLEPGGTRARASWWDWSETKAAVERLFAWGEVVSVGRENFARRYALAADVLPDSARCEVPREEAIRALISRASRSSGVATLHDLADYHRIRAPEARTAVQELEEAGELLPVCVEGWESPRGGALPAWVHRDARVPRTLGAEAVLTPFDPVVWYRPRAERMFDFSYRLEIYTPAEKRTYGYYCLPLLVDDRLVGRIDLKADRAGQQLIVRAAWQEPGAPSHTAAVATRLLAEAAAWQGLAGVRSEGVGTLALPARFDAAEPTY